MIGGRLHLELKVRAHRATSTTSAACIAEPVLASLGGGFLLARPAGAAPELFDFFVQTPRRFGGAHSVAVAPDGSTHGAGDPRRGGVGLQVG
ncbi:hypothetical protein [Thiocapsa sp. UBA6158]|jgi:gamma-glutamyltranspeptidase|uniref:hypothetical protein n=1 Tax=Thiocapsa sp. UBA6158 TaxID=1947692 RepID=UPI0025F5A377|nr:hypothetical protein [Thiocapsa sp. UBA6158]